MITALQKLYHAKRSWRKSVCDIWMAEMQISVSLKKIVTDTHAITHDVSFNAFFKFYHQCP